MPRNSVARYALTNRLTRLSDCLDVSRIMARRDRESRPSDEKLVSREREGAHKASCVREYLSAMAALDAPTSGRSGPTPVPTRAQSTYLVSLNCFSLLTVARLPWYAVTDMVPWAFRVTVIGQRSGRIEHV